MKRVGNEGIEGPRRVTDPFEVLSGRITLGSVFTAMTHEPVVVNHEELDDSRGTVNPMFGRALRSGRGLKKGSFGCGGSDFSFFNQWW